MSGDFPAIQRPRPDSRKAAHRAGLTEVIPPARNEPDLDDLPETVRKAMTIHLASDVRQVLDWALEPVAAKVVPKI